jgi:hypothetical protein
MTDPATMHAAHDIAAHRIDEDRAASLGRLAARRIDEGEREEKPA